GCPVARGARSLGRASLAREGSTGSRSDTYNRPLSVPSAEMVSMSVPYVIERPQPAQRPVLDPQQQAVLDHPGGPLLVLAGPGTGTTTTVVETVVERIETRGMDPDSILVLTFGRKAAHELRARIAGRLSRTTGSPAMTFHSFCYALVREHSDPQDWQDPVRLMSAPE